MHEVHADPAQIHSFHLAEITSLMTGNFGFPKVIENVHENETDFWTCATCAEGWLAQLEREAVAPFSELVHMEVDDVQHALSSVDFLSANADILSLGAFKTVLACDFAVDSILTIPNEHFRECMSRRIPRGVSVDLGFCHEPSGFRILSGPLANLEGYVTKAVYRMAFQSGHLVMMVRCIDGPMYGLYPGSITLCPEFAVGGELDIFSDSIQIIAWDILAMAYHNEKLDTSRRFFGLVE